MSTIGNIGDIEFVILDFETTGLFPNRHRVIEVGAAIVKSGSIISTFSSLCLPDLKTKIPSIVTKLTGISIGMLQNKPTTSEVIFKLVSFIGSRPVLAHNVMIVCL
jgi:DNA polymerase III alpha subunit (gram-positive type)